MDGNAGLMDLSSASVRWLFEPKETVRIFRFTINEPDGQSYVLYQAAQYLPGFQGGNSRDGSLVDAALLSFRWDSAK